MSIAQLTQIRRLEKALGIALLRAHGQTDHKTARFLIEGLEADAEAPEYAPRPYQAWQDTRRLINQLEALEAAHGVQHVRVQVPSAYRTGEFYV